MALVPKTGGVFTVTIWYSGAGAGSEGESGVATQEMILWDRKRDGGFPGTFKPTALFLLYIYVALCDMEAFPSMSSWCFW